jgi:hypothetical protein
MNYDRLDTKISKNLSLQLRVVRLVVLDLCVIMNIAID